MISGVVLPELGPVSIFGRSPRDPMEARALGVAMIFQEVLVAETLSVVDNIFAGTDSLWKRSRTRAVARRQCRDLLKRFTETEIDPDTIVRNLPLSVQQWIVIARALLANPRVLILDESSAALDLDASARLHTEIKRLRESGCCIIIVTHRIAELVRIADRATVLRDGEVVDEFVGADINESRLLSAMSAKRIILEAKAAAASPANRAVGDVVLSATGLEIERGVPQFDFNLCAGEIVGVTGLDGQGHGDFLRIAAGLTRRQAELYPCWVATPGMHFRQRPGPRAKVSPMFPVTVRVRAYFPTCRSSKTSRCRSTDPDLGNMAGSKGAL